MSQPAQSNEIDRYAQLLQEYGACPVSDSELEFNCPVCGRATGRFKLPRNFWCAHGCDGVSMLMTPLLLPGVISANGLDAGYQDGSNAPDQGSEQEAANEQPPIADSGRTPDERIEDILDEAANLSEQEFRRNLPEIWRQINEKRQMERGFIVSEVRQRRAERRSAPQPGQSTEQLEDFGQTAGEQQQADEPADNVIPLGRYPVRIVEVQSYQLDSRGRQIKDAKGQPVLRRTQKGDPSWQLTIEVAAGPYQGRQLRDWLNFSKKGMGKPRDLCVALELAKGDEDSIELDPEDLSNKLCWAIVDQHETARNGRTYARIAFRDGYARMSAEEARGFTVPPKLTRIDSAAVHDEFCKEGARLLPQHRQQLVDSAIKPEVARDRGYRTIWTKRELGNCGFGPSQQITPTMLIPSHGPKGQLVGYQHRPDTPRMKGDPLKPIKYETPHSGQTRIDVPLSLSRKSVIQNDAPYFDTTEVLAPIVDPRIPLFITEGCKKADSAASCDLCCIALLGVWNWRGTNNAGGKTALADWDDIALNDRSVYIAFDSDLMINPDVHAALHRLHPFLTQRGATVRFIYLPPGPNGEKTGLDDFIAREVKAGTTPHDIRTKLLEYAAEGLRPLPDSARPRDDDNPVKWPFTLKDDGVWSAEVTRGGAEYELFVCSRLEIVATTRNQDGLEWGRVLAFKDDDGRAHEYALPMELMAGDGTVYRERLLSMGLHIGAEQKARNRLHEYIQTTTPQARMISVSRLGWHGQAFVMPDVVYGEAGAESVIYQPVRSGEHSLRESGSLAEWQEHIGQLYVGNTRLVFAVSCAFAAPLLYLTDSESGGFHFRGDSSVGKTTAGWAGGSVWGGGGIRGYIKGWRTTINGLENVATVHSDALLVLDEIGQAESKAVAQAAYLLANGQGASRMRRDTSSRPVATWRTLYLSSGEISLAAKVEEDGQRKASAGQEIRILDIPARASDKLGLFEDLHGAPSGQEFADNIRKAAGTYYGTPIREYLPWLTAGIDAAKEAIEAAKADFLAAHLPKDARASLD
jgi:hypothetical protein